MKYEERMPCAPGPGVCDSTERRAEDLTVLLHQTRAIAGDVLMKARSVKEHLFGREPEGCNSEEDIPDAFCFQDELLKVRYILVGAYDALNELSCRLGVE